MNGARSRLLDVFLTATKLGLTSFGGPIAHLGYFRHEYVERRAWLSEAAYADLVALCQVLPGPVSSQVGIAIGTLRAGRLGGLLAWIGFTGPSAVALVAFATLVTNTDMAPAGWVHGLKLAAVAVVAAAVVAMWRALAGDAPRSAIAIGAAAVALTVPSAVSQIAIIVGGGLIGWAALRADARPVAAPEPPRIGRRFAVLCLVAFGVLLVGLPILRAAIPSHPIALAEAFDRAGSLVFGGGHVVLPILHESVVGPGWVSEDRFLAGYGAAQAVPGPLFTFAAYLGAAQLPQPNGPVGALIALVAIFLPSFLLIWGALPFWHQVRRSGRLLRALSGTTAAVVGILLAALVTPVWTSTVGGPQDAFVALALFGLLVAERVPPWIIVALGASGGEALSRLS